MPKKTSACPLCGAHLLYEERYPDKLCDSCSERTVDANGLGVTFFNVSFSGGLAAEYKDTGKSYESNICYVNGIRCQADEHRFGGIVIQPY